MFQSTRPCGARRTTGRRVRRRGAVSIHAPVRGATSSSQGKNREKKCFNPRARAGRDAIHAYSAKRMFRVSIHAPVRGATWICSQRPAGRARVSIHAPVRGATSDRPLWAMTKACFNPRARAGRDLRRADTGHHYYVSIHAPVRGATIHVLQRTPRHRVSIHAPVRGATPVPGPGRHHTYVSIHAPVRGATQWFLDNPGADMLVSIHAPVRGATGNRAFVER